jgi:ABC-type polysaccharide/polyol phosphate export permease
LAAIPVLFSFLLLVVGGGLFLSVLYCFARDVEHIWSIASRMLLFITPVFYAPEMLSVPARLAVRWLNPLTPHVLALRAALRGTPDFPDTIHALVAGALVFGLGYAAFLKLEGAALEHA